MRSRGGRLWLAKLSDPEVAKRVFDDPMRKDYEVVGAWGNVIVDVSSDDDADDVDDDGGNDDEMFNDGTTTESYDDDDSSDDDCDGAVGNHPTKPQGGVSTDDVKSPTKSQGTGPDCIVVTPEKTQGTTPAASPETCDEDVGLVSYFGC